jgi:hypothetical protein
MHWQIPRYEEIKMDAEIGSYQSDDETPPYYVRTLPALAVQAAGGSTGSSSFATEIEACSA